MVSTDIGNICSVSNSYLRFDEPNSMLAAMSFGNCGYALPALIGAKLGRPDRPAVAYVGDGAWCMSFQELLTCVRERIPVTAVVFQTASGVRKRRTRWTSTAAVSSAAICRTRTSPSWRARWGRKACGSSTPTRWATRCARPARRSPRQDHGAGDDGEPGTGRSVPPRRAQAAGALLQSTSPMSTSPSRRGNAAVDRAGGTHWREDGRGRIRKYGCGLEDPGAGIRRCRCVRD